MEECLFAAVGIAIALAVLGGAIAGIVALVQTRALRERLARIEARLASAAPASPPAPAPEPARVAPVPVIEKEAPVAPVARWVSDDLPPELIRAPAPPPKPSAPPHPARSLGDWETLIGTRLLTYVGGVVLFLSAAFFVKYAFDNNWLGPSARVALGVLFGIAMLVAGEAARRREMVSLGQGLIGAGLAVVYVSIFAAQGHYHILGTTVAFAALVVVSMGGMALAVLHNAVAMAVLATLGGFLTPVLLSTGVDARDALFGYVLLLDAGVLAAAWFRHWRALDVLALAGTWGLYWGWYGDYYTESAVWPAFAWIGAFFVVFQTLPFVRSFRAREVFGLERFILALANATIAFGMAYPMLATDHDAALAAFALGLAAVNAGFGALTLRRVPEENLGALGFIGLGVTFLTVAVPVYLDLRGVTLLWAVEGPALLALALRFRYKPLRWGALVVTALAVMRLVSTHGFYHDGAAPPVFNASFGVWLFTAAAVAVFAWMWRREADRTAYETPIVHGAGLVAAAVAVGGLAAELRAYLAWGYSVVYEAPTGLWRFRPQFFVPPFAWLAGSLALFEAARRRAWLPAAWAGAVVAALATIGLLAAYDHSITGAYRWLANPRFIVAALGVVALGWMAAKRPDDERHPDFARASGTGLWIAAAAAAFALLSFENYTAFSAMTSDGSGRWIGQMAVTITWGLYAASLLVLGFQRGKRSLRLTALGLFGLAAAKLVLVDMAGIKQVWRILAFVAIGTLMIAASYLYHRVEQSLGDKEAR